MYRYPVGLFKEGTIKDTNVNNAGDFKVKLDSSAQILGDFNQVVRFPHLYSDNDGLFIGAFPSENTPVTLLQGAGNEHIVTQVRATNSAILPTLSPGQILIKTNDNTKLFFDKGSNITIGSSAEFIHLNTDLKIFNNNFDQQYNFSQGHRKTIGVVKRDLKQDSGISDINKLISDENENFLKIISLDPSFGNSKINYNKNPAYVEDRELVYEFESDANVLDIMSESKLYSTKGYKLPFVNNNRRLARTDALSLSLVSPNHLIESIKGTVVDIYGNPLDLNRYPLQIGKGNLTLKSASNATAKDKEEIYFSIMREQRRALAFHFEINARKEFSNLPNNVPDVNSSINYSRDRSRFFIDVDKEGQFKINIPASSESGNIPLLSRYENASTLNISNPNEFILNPKDKLDILHDSFLVDKGVVSVLKNSVEVTPLDRLISNDNNQATHIKHGMVYHNILDTCYLHQGKFPLSSILIDPIRGWEVVFPNKFIDFDIASKNIEIGTNAGGRSGSINLDGSLEMNIGANTIDRQSLWLDTAGGMVANIGRDKNNVSAAIAMDGHLILQVGTAKGRGVNNDSRFPQSTQEISGVVDVRVYTEENKYTAIRIDKEGINLIAPGSIFLQSNRRIVMACSGNMEINAENILFNGTRMFDIIGPTSQ